jgi:uncharacterized membrane protein
MKGGRIARAEPAVERSRSFWVAFLIGAGIMAAVDEIIFHQLLGWHHFYDLSTPAVGLASDGVLHAAQLIAIVAGFFLFSDLRRRQALAYMWAWAGFFFGAGVFQVFDGVVNHKVLRLHQIRYGVHLLPYDVAWIGSGLLLVLVGAVLLMRARRAGGAGIVSGSAR